MESPDRKVKKGKKHPRVPIKTYKWEDIRRSRSKGGYPWTYLYKQPFNEELDPEPYTMEGMRKSKSSSTMGVSDVEISEITDTAEEFQEKLSISQIITEPDDHSIKCSSSSIVIEECDGNIKEKQGAGLFFLDSAESSDDISQYLDKEERGPSEKTKETVTAMVIEEEGEDAPSRKRKLSADSSYSRISLTKTAILKKIEDTKAKIKVPKISFPVSKYKKSVPKKQNNSPPETKKDTKKKNISSEERKPVYIHIPLKPPPGESDDFSHLEYDSNRQQNKKPSFKDLVKNMKQLHNVNKDQLVEETEAEDDTAAGNADLKEETDNMEDTVNRIEEDPKSEAGDKLTTKEVDIETEYVTKQQPHLGKTVLNKKRAEKEETESKQPDTTKEIVSKNETGNTEELGTQEDPETEDSTKIARIEEDLDTKQIISENNSPGNALSETKSHIEDLPPEENQMDTDDTQLHQADDPVDTPSESEGEAAQPVDKTKYDDMFDNLFAASTNKETDTQASSTDRKTRSKSAEPERKRKLSLESSYSRKSLSKLGIMKKLKDASDKIKKTFSRPSLKKQTEPKTEPVEKVTASKSKQVKPVAPVYIHIPLKPSEEEEKDEIPHCQIEDEPKTADTDSTVQESPSPTDVQIIFLTAPSDDETLDYNSSDVPETPSSDNKVFFATKINELKELAKGAVDKIADPKEKLHPVREETRSEEIPQETQLEELPVNTNHEVVEKILSDESEKDNVLVDKEDGLSEKKATKKEDVVEKEQLQNTEDITENVITTEDMINKEIAVEGNDLKSSLKGEGSPVLKKKVSFKRRSKTSKDDSYEDVQVIVEAVPKELKCPPDANLEVIQSECVDEATTHLDVEVINSTSLDEDYNNWSKISDHEYEPVNPPPDNIEVISTMKISENPTVCIIDTDQILNNTQPLSWAEEEVYKQDPAFQLKFQKESQKHIQPREGPSKFQQAIRQGADNLKTRLHNIKKPKISLPDRPKFHKFTLPKIPDTAKINLPSFSLPRRQNAKRPPKERHQSIECNDGDAKKPIFDFTTYPRLFKKNPRERTEQEVPSFATVPRTKNREKPAKEETVVDSRWGADSETMRVPLHTENSFDTELQVAPEDTSKELYMRGDSIDEDEPSHIRYDDDIDSEDEYDRENRELNRERDFLRRWDQGTYNTEQEFIENIRNVQPRITDLDSPEDMPEDQTYQFATNNNDQRIDYSSGSSQGGHRQGVLEEINSDEFFLRQKGISQDNIEVGKYLSNEIREAFRTPVNALSQMQDDNAYELRSSNQSLPEKPPIKRKPKSVKKPKRKTPHTSQEKVHRYKGESGEEEEEEDIDKFTPPTPKRRSRRSKKQMNIESIIPYQETISLDVSIDHRMDQHRESLGILGDDEQDEDVAAFVKMAGDNGKMNDTYKNFDFIDEEDIAEDLPAVPPRKQKSLKSLNVSENESILGDFSSNKAMFSSEKEILEPEITAIRTESKIIIPIETDPPKRPSRTRSRTNSHSRGTSQIDDETVSLNTESIVSENQIPCVEEPCIKDLRDSMGYAIIDKSKVRDPPLPPPRIPTRRKKSFRNERQFFTVPRSSADEDLPVRPLRNYSTVGNSRKSLRSNTYENKENIDIMQYIEVEDEPSRHLQSGDVIKKMKDRPLPPPPRPPRKTRGLRDITSQENIMAITDNELNKIATEEIEVSTQTEPLPDDFICEEVVQEPTDTIIIPTRDQDKPPILPGEYTYEGTMLEPPRRSRVKRQVGSSEEFITREATSRSTDTNVIPTRSQVYKNPNDESIPLTEQKVKLQQVDMTDKTAQFISREAMTEITKAGSQEEKPVIETRLVTPTTYTYEETITHGSLLVKPLEGAKLLPDSELTQERIIPVEIDSDVQETSSIPEEFGRLTDPREAVEERGDKEKSIEKLVDPRETVGERGSKEKPIERTSESEEKSILSPYPIKPVGNSKESSQNQIAATAKPNEFDVLKAQKLQVTDLDVDTLTVNKLLAEKIVVSEIDSSNIQTNEISSKTGALKVGEIALPPGVITQILDTIRSSQGEDKEKHQTGGELGIQKKTLTSVCDVGGNVLDNAQEENDPLKGANDDSRQARLESPPQLSDNIEQVIKDITTPFGEPDPDDVHDSVEQQSLEEDSPPKPPPRSSDSTTPKCVIAPHRPPRQAEKQRASSVSNQEESLQEPDVDDEPPPRPPQPQMDYIPSQPPASFYAMRAQKYVESLGDSIPTAPRRRRHTKSKQISRSSSEDSSVATPASRRYQRRSSDLSVVQLSGQLVRVCGSEVNSSLKRLIRYILNNMLRNDDGKQDLNVMILIVLVLIAGLILLGYGDEKTVVHLHHWEYFNPPGSM